MKKSVCAELRRLLESWRFYAAILGVAGAFFFSLERGGLKQSVMESFIAAMLGSGIHTAAIFCAFAFAGVFCEDFEHQYCYYALIRGNVKRYVFTKTLLIYLSSVFVMVAGTAVFLGICAGRIPWTVTDDPGYGLAVRSHYGILAEKGNYVGYCILYAVQVGMYFGTLSLAAAFLSLFSVNRMLVLIFPAFLDQLLTELPTRELVSFLCVTPFSKHFDYNWQMFLNAAAASILPAMLLTAGIYVKAAAKVSQKAGVCLPFKK